MIYVKKIIILLVICVLALVSRYIWQIGRNEARVVMVGPGYGLEINGGRVLTALHVAEIMDYPILYQNTGKDIAIIATNHGNKYSLKLAASKEEFIFTDIVPIKGESGTPYMIGNKVYGVIIGESGGRGLVAALDETIIAILYEK